MSLDIRLRVLTNMQSNLGKLLIIGAILVTATALVRGFYYYPNDEVENDSGLLVARPSDSPRAATALPERLLIPKIGVDADIQHLGITSKGNMAAPNNFVDTGWYKYGTVPGDLGSAVIAGHEDNAISTPGVFYDLNQLEIGDTMEVVGENGGSLTFRVVDKQIHPYNLTGPELEKIFNLEGKARLNLITCAGDWLPQAKTNDQRLVIYTELVN
jgi:LPXTG-site transpeptidase (sortase) family protein